MTRPQKLLRELIALPSVNPAFAAGNRAFAGEHRVAECLASLAKRAGLDVELQPVLPGRANLLARVIPRAKVRTRVLLAPHLDTVGGAELPGRLFTPRLQGGRLYGRGACDTKASVAAMFGALCDLAVRAKPPAQTEVVFVGLIDEESVQAGSRALIASGWKADLAIVGEPTCLQVVTAHKGVVWLDLRTYGKAAHGARPELGRNAVHAMARIVDLLETRYARQLRRKRHPLLGHATVNVGSIQGGRQPNIVPSECVCSIDRRTLPGESEAHVLWEIKRLLRQKALSAEMRSRQSTACLPLETNPAFPLVRQFMASCGQRRPAGVDFFSDAGVLSHGGVPSVVFGPGDIAQAHTPDEWVALDQVEAAKAMLLSFLRSLP